MNGKFKIILQASAILLLACCAKNRLEPSEEIITKYYSFNHIESITAASSAVMVYYSQEKYTSIKAEGPANMLDALRVKTNANGTIMIELEDINAFNITSDSQFIKVWVSSPSINSFEVMGGASIIVPESICSPTTVTINAYTSSKAFFSDIKSQFLRANAFQGSKISIDRLQSSYIKATPYTGATIIIAGDTIKQ